MVFLDIYSENRKEGKRDFTKFTLMNNKTKECKRRTPKKEEGILFKFYDTNKEHQTSRFTHTTENSVNVQSFYTTHLYIFSDADKK